MLLVSQSFLTPILAFSEFSHPCTRVVSVFLPLYSLPQGFLTNSGRVNLQRVQLIMQDLGRMEDEIFKSRQRRELSFRARNKAQRRQKRADDARKQHLGGQFAPQVRRDGIAQDRTGR